MIPLVQHSYFPRKSQQYCKICCLEDALSSVANSSGLGVCAKSLSNIVKFAVLKMLLAVLQNLLVWESVTKGLSQLALAGPVLGS